MNMMNFGQALEVLKQGKKIRRISWHLGIYIYLVQGSVRNVDELRGEAAEHVGSDLTAFAAVRISSHIDMRAADGSIIVGWTASQTDMLAEDWEAVD